MLIVKFRRRTCGRRRSSYRRWSAFCCAQCSPSSPRWPPCSDSGSPGCSCHPPPLLLPRNTSQVQKRIWTWQRLSLLSAVTDCPSGWLPYNHTCLHQIPGALTWSEARETCHKLSAKLPGGDNISTETSVLHKFIVSKFPSPLWMTRNLSRNSDRCRVLTAPTNGAAAILEDQCDKKLTGVCIKGRKGSLRLEFLSMTYILPCTFGINS